MIDKEILEQTPYIAVMRLTNKYKFYWQDKSNLFWFWRLLQEFIELLGSILHLHRDPIKWELIQIASMCINWMYKLSDDRNRERDDI